MEPTVGSVGPKHVEFYKEAFLCYISQLCLMVTLLINSNCLKGEKTDVTKCNRF